jgi:hypothetical protein
MTKFLKITNAPFTGQLISCNGIKAVKTLSATATLVTIDYVDGTTTSIITAPQVDSDVYLDIVNSIEIALSTGWTSPYFEMILPKAVTSILNA